MRAKEKILLGLLFLICLDLSLIYNLADLDVWARLAVGKLVFELGHVSYQDVFAYTPTKALWVDHEWGSGTVFFAVYDLFGQGGLLALRVLLYFGTALWLHLCVRERIGNADSLLLHGLLVYALLFAFYVTVRSQAFTYFLFALWMYLLERSRNGKTWALTLLPITMIFWANLHAGFLSGLGLLVIYGAGERLNHRPWKRYVLLLLLCGLVTLANPYGVKYWTYVFEAVTMARPDIVEWQAFDFFGPVESYLGFKLLLLLSAFIVLVGLFRKIKIDWVDVLLLIITFTLAARHIRHIPFFCIVSFPFLYASFRHLGDLMARKRAKTVGVKSAAKEQWERIEALGYGTVRGLLFAVAVLLAFNLPLRVSVPPWMLPVNAIEFIRANHLQGNLLIPFSWGSYAIWRLFPQCKVSIDGRFEEVYPDTTYNEIRTFTHGKRGWRRVLEKYEHDLILVHSSSPIVVKMKKEKEWTMVFEDDLSNLYVPSKSWRGEGSYANGDVTNVDPFSRDDLRQ